MENKSIIRKDINKNKNQILLIIILGLVSASSGVALMYISGYLISKASLQIGNILMLQVPTVLTRTFSLSQSVFSYIQRLVSHDLVLKIIEKMRSKVYKILEPMGLRLRKEYKSGDLLGLISEDIENLQNIYLKSIFPSVVSLLMYTIFITIVFSYDIYYFLISLLFGIFLIFIIPFFSLIFTKKSLVVMKEAKHTLYRDFTSAIFGVTDLVSSGKKQEFLDDYKTKEDILLNQERKTKNFIHFREVIIHLFATAVIVSIIYFCQKLVSNNIIENVYVASFCMMTLSVLSVVTMTGEAISQIPAYQVSINRVKDFYNSEQKEDIYKKGSYREDVENILELKDVSFSYDNNKKILKNINLKIKKGEKVAILGRSGVGKSTLIKLITGTHKNYSGEIKIFGNNPDEDILGSKVSLLNQKPYLFDMTIKENIELAILNNDSEDVNNSLVEDSLKKAHIYDLIEQLPEKLNTNVYESGSRFSGGERQRIAFARTLIQNNSLLLLDEPTIGLDPKTETDVLKTIFKNSENNTIIWITHHFNSIEHMDRIIFISNGEIEMDGSHEYLYNNNEKYRKLYELDMAL